MSDFEIVARQDFSDVTYLLEVRHPQMARAAKPGQFVIVMADETSERIPLTIADYDRERGTVTQPLAVGRVDEQQPRPGRRLEQPDRDEFPRAARRRGVRVPVRAALPPGDARRHAGAPLRPGG